MRNELERIQKIEQYLKGQLPETEKVTFEEQIARDPALQEEVRLQQDILQGIERTALKQKIQKAGIRYRRMLNLTRWALAGLVAVILVVAILYYKGGFIRGGRAYEGKALPEYNESGEKSWAAADSNLVAQTFLVEASTDTVIETKGGILLSVPAAAFQDKDGQTVKGKITLVVKEALDEASILRAGLSTRSGNQLLETGGMFFIDARKNGQVLTIDPSHGIYAEVPTDTIKPGMQAFQGKRLPDGTIDWVSPRPLDHNLIPVDIHLLDFYPPLYLDSLSKWGYNARDKRFTDSLYYSLTRPFREGGPTRPSEGDSDSTYQSQGGSDGTYQINPECGIDPAKIKAIWGTEFQNTLLSTREFEQRISWIHTGGDRRVLDLYVNHLDKNLSTIDSMAASLFSGKLKALFLSFAARQDGKVKNGLKQYDKLREYYQKKARAFAEAVAKTQQEYWNKQAELDNLAGRKQLEHQSDSINRVNSNFQEEFDLNLKEAYRQLGVDTSVKPRPLNTAAYQVTVTNTGWCNVDRYVYESLLTRTSLNFTDTQTAQKATIRYLPVSFRVESASAYDRLYVYLLPEKLSSFMRLNGSNGEYAEKLNELMKYDLVCIAYKDDQAFFYSRENISPENYSGITMTRVSTKELEQYLNKRGNGTQTSALQRENDFFRFDIIDQKRQQHNRDLEELTRKIMVLIYPCYWQLPAK